MRVHTDAEANSLSREINARAFTVGRDIFVGSGQYNPYSSAGRSLLAHELTHTIQQQTNTASRQVVQRRLIEPSKIPVAKSPKPRSPLAPSTPAIAKLLPSLPPALQAKAASEPVSESGLKATETGTVVSPESKEELPPAAVPLTPTAPVPVPEKPLEEIAADKEAKEEKVPPEPGAAAPAVEAEPLAPRSPQDDPDFQGVVKQVKQVASQQQRHGPAPTKAKQAQDAAVSPAGERESQAQANQVDQMAQAPTPAFDAGAFKAALLKRIAKLAPKTLQGVDEFKKSNKLADAKQAMTAQVNQGKAASQEPLAEKTQQKPDTSSIKPKPVTKLPPVAAGKAPTSIGAGRATPKPQPASTVETPLQKGSQQLNQEMKQAGVTEQQLAQSNEPAFQDALAAKQTVQKHSIVAPQAYRQSEQNQLSQAKGEATASAQAQLQGMHGDRAQLLTQVMGQQVAAKEKDEQARAKIAGDIQKIYQTTKTNVEKILKELDGKVNQVFDRGATAAKQAFENYVDRRMKDFRWRRYYRWGPIGFTLWVKDKVTSPPPEVNEFYQEGRQRFLSDMDGVIDKVATLVTAELKRAQGEVQKGKQAIQDYVAKLPEQLKAIGKETATKVQGKFDDLEQNVANKANALIDTLAKKYQANLKAVDERIKKLKAANEGLLTKAVKAVKGAIKTILKLKAMLTKVLAKVAHVVPFILAHPIRFLGNLIAGLKQQVIDQIKGLVITQVITAGVKWILSLLSPAGALVKAAMAIYEIVMFFVDRGSQILQLVNSVVDAVAAIAKGALAGAAKLVETTLVRVLPLAISFLASLLGLSGLAKKVEAIIGKIRKRIDNAINTMLLKAKRIFRNKGKQGKSIRTKTLHRKLIRKALKAIDAADQGKDMKEIIENKTKIAQAEIQLAKKQLSAGLKYKITAKVEVDRKTGKKRLIWSAKIAPNITEETLAESIVEVEKQLEKFAETATADARNKIPVVAIVEGIVNGKAIKVTAFNDPRIKPHQWVLNQIPVQHKIYEKEGKCAEVRSISKYFEKVSESYPDRFLKTAKGEFDERESIAIARTIKEITVRIIPSAPGAHHEIEQAVKRVMRQHVKKYKKEKYGAQIPPNEFTKLEREQYLQLVQLSGRLWLKINPCREFCRGMIAKIESETGQAIAVNTYEHKELEGIIVTQASFSR